MSYSKSTFQMMLMALLITGATSACGRPGNARNDLTNPKAEVGSPDSLSLEFTTREAPEGMGFLNPNDPTLPQAVKKTASSVFTIALPAGKLVSANELFNTKSLQEMLRKIESAPASESLGAAERAIYADQVNQCIQQAAENCQIFEGVSYGTGFVTGDGRDLRTALHVVEDFVRNARATGASAQIPIYILGKKREILFGPHNLEAQVEATLEGALDTSVYKGPDAGRFNLDQVLIRLSKRIANPIAISKRPLRDGEAAFIVSVPQKTNDRKEFGADDSDGVTVKISKGTAMSEKSLAKRLAKAGLGEQTGMILEEATALTADGAPRSSGGAILNQQGEAVGIYTSGLPQSGAAFEHRVSYGGNSLIDRTNSIE